VILGGRIVSGRARCIAGLVLIGCVGAFLVSMPSASATTPGMAHVSGNAGYGDSSPDAGVIVELWRTPGEAHRTAYTDEAGDWDAGELPAGTYSVSYEVITHFSGGSEFLESVGSEQVELTPGQHKALQTTLSGSRPLGEIVVDVHGEGPSSYVSASVAMPDGGTQNAAPADADGRFHLFAPSGSYEVTGDGGSDTAPTTLPVSVLDGHESAITIQLQALPVPPGTVAHEEQQDLTWLNQQRERWGLPAGLVSVPKWSQACAAHDAYGKLNSVLEHPENLSLPGSSQGGNWAGPSSVLAAGGAWSSEYNPWMDAPLHLMQLFNPTIGYIGLDDTESWSCATTWPGMFTRHFPEGTIWTFPGDGTSGLPPSEFASEFPFVPGSEVGIEGLAGRELFVWEDGTSLTSASGPAEVRWVDKNSRSAPYVLGGIILPVKPLLPSTTYTASVTVGAAADGTPPQTTHTWTFTTGPENAGGVWGGHAGSFVGQGFPISPGSVGSSSSSFWDEPGVEGRESTANRSPRVTTSYAHARVRVRGVDFVAGGHVVVRLAAGRASVLAKAMVDGGGRFQTSFKWPKKTIALRVVEGGESVTATFRARAHGHGRA
jgi:hypothetical protein